MPVHKGAEHYKKAAEHHELAARPSGGGEVSWSRSRKKAALTILKSLQHMDFMRSPYQGK
jgi:hypothetical protein